MRNLDVRGVVLIILSKSAPIPADLSPIMQGIGTVNSNLPATAGRMQ
jgi:hypothetical protein